MENEEWKKEKQPPSFILHSAFCISFLRVLVSLWPNSDHSVVALSARTMWTMPQVRLVACADEKPTFFNNSII